MYLMVDNFDSFTYNLYALFRLSGVEIDVIKNNEYIDADKYEAIILSPGPSNPENSGTTLKYLENYAGKKPIFGVCLGMQAIGHYMGYKITHAKKIMHGKQDTIIPKDGSRILDGIDDFTGVRYHSLAVAADDSVITANAKSDGEVMGIEDESRMLYGVQFHPESIKSEFGEKIVENFKKIVSEAK